MKLLKKGIVVILIALGLTVFISEGYGGESGDIDEKFSRPVDYLPLTVGSNWTYTILNAKRDVLGEYKEKIIGTEVVSGVTCRVIEAKVNGVATEKIWIEKNSDAIKTHKEMDVITQKVTTYNPPLLFANLPFVVGEVVTNLSRIATTSVVSGKNISYPYTFKTVIETEKSVTTPMGTFNDCIRVKEIITEPEGERICYRWFAPGVGMIKSEDTKDKDIILLRSYTLK